MYGRSFLRAVWCAATLLFCSWSAPAQDFPAKTITIVVPFPPGASIDLLGRVMAEMLSKQLGQTVIVHNVAGAASALGTRQVARAAPDGYTLLVGGSSMVANLFGLKEPGYAMSDFAAIGGIGFSPFALVINNKSTGAKTLGEFVAYASKNPGKLKFGSLGGFSTQTLVAGTFADAAEVEWRTVPFRGAADQLTALLAGEIDAVFLIPNMVAPVKDQANIVPLGLSAKRRDEYLPEVPTFDELGVSGVNGHSLFSALYVPAGTPQPVLEKLRSAFAAGAETEEFKAALKKAGVAPFPAKTIAEFDEFSQRFIQEFGETFKRLGIEPQ
jgi:tripartite-type tricarboxylate transporter receptor subunit TctC